MSKMWEVDPETKRKLQELGKREGNTTCCDCGAPAPQWASPKFGIFICLNCAGIHRSLGVHISFVRSITMDQFKTEEIVRMDKGGNLACKNYFLAQPEFSQSMSIAMKYGALFAEDYKEKLTAQVEGREWEGPKPRKKVAKSSSPSPQRTNASRPISPSALGSNINSITNMDGEMKARNEEYFGKLGQMNANRPDNLPPSQGGKYSGFGSTPSHHESGSSTGDNSSEDIASTLTKGFWNFASTVTRATKTAHEQFIIPTAQKIADSEITKKGIETATGLGQKVSETGKYGYETISRWADQQQSAGSRGRYGLVATGAQLDDERREFWDSFGADRDSDHDQTYYDNSRESAKIGGTGGGSLGTSTMRRTTSMVTTKDGAISTAGLKKVGGGGKKEERDSRKSDDGWDDW